MISEEEEEVNDFVMINEKGYLVMESFASEDEIGALRKRMSELLTQFDCSVSSIFSTKNQVSLSLFLL